jgi:hypothetical protein
MHWINPLRALEQTLHKEEQLNHDLEATPEVEKEILSGPHEDCVDILKRLRGSHDRNS